MCVQLSRRLSEQRPNVRSHAALLSALSVRSAASSAVRCSCLVADFWCTLPSRGSCVTAATTSAFSAVLLCSFSDRHEVICKEILELDPWENQWNVVAINVLMHDSYDVCLVARMNPRDLIPPPSDLVEEGGGR